MHQNENVFQSEELEIKESLSQIKKYLENNIDELSRDVKVKDSEIKRLKSVLESLKHTMEGNRQLINKLLGEHSKLQNDIEWYKRTYERRSLLGTIRQKIFKK